MAEVEYGPDRRGNYRFGYGEYYHVPNFDNFSLETKTIVALTAGWSHGCPVAKELSDPSNLEFGPDKIAPRYLSVNRTHSQIVSATSVYKPSLYRDLLRPIRRREGEPAGLHEPESVPKSYLIEMAPMTNIYGYASPRVVLEILQDPTVDSRNLITEMVGISYSRRELLLELSNLAFELGVEPTSILKHTLSREVLEEENCRTHFIDLANRLENRSPHLMSEYRILSPQDRVQLGIAEIPNN